MGFETPNALYLLLLAIPLTLLYFLKLKRESLRVPSLLLWSQVLEDKRVNSPFQRFKRHLSLLLQLLMLLLLAFAAAQPYIKGSAGETSTLLPVVIDNSASMAARSPDGGPTRLDLAKDAARALIKGMPRGQAVALISFSNGAVRRCGFTDDSAALLQALERIRVEDLPAQIDGVLRTLDAMSRERAFDEAVLLSDGNFDSASDFTPTLPFKLVYRRIDVPSSNAGIVSFNAKSSGEGRWTLYAGIRRTDSSKPLPVLLRSGGKPVAKTSLAPGGSREERVSFDVDGLGGSTLELRLEPEGFDALRSDDSAFLSLPVSRPLRVYVDPEIGAVSAALKGVSGLRFETLPGADVDLLVTNSAKRAEDSSARVVLGAGFIPERLRDYIEMADKSSTVIDWLPLDPLLQYAQLSELLIMGDPTLKSAKDGSLQALPERFGYEAVASGQDGPLILKRSGGGRVEYDFLFDISKSTLPYRVAFPVMMSNLVSLARTQAGLADAAAFSTGVLPPLRLAPGQPCEISTPDGATLRSSASSDGLLAGVPAVVAGRYRIMAGGYLKAEYEVSLLNGRETSLVGVDEVSVGSKLVAADAGERFAPRRPLWPFLALAAFVLLVFEWWYFNKLPKRASRGMLLAFALLPLCLCDAVARQPSAPPLRLSILSPQMESLSDSASQVSLVFYNDSKAEFAGKPDLKFFDGSKLGLEYLADELVIAPGVQRRRLLLPSFRDVLNLSSIKVSLRLDDGSEIDLGETPTPFRLVSDKFFRDIVYVKCRMAASSSALETARRLNPAFYMPELEAEKTPPSKKTSSPPSNKATFGKAAFDISGESASMSLGEFLKNGVERIRCGVRALDSADFPLWPEALCQYGIAVLDGDGLSSLDSQQLDSLARWLLAGGSACLMLDARPLDFERRRFLELLISKSPAPAKDFDCDGVKLLYAGLGRLAIVERDFSDEKDFSSKTWRRLAGFLHFVRASRLDYFAEHGLFFGLEEPVNATRFNGSAYVGEILFRRHGGNSLHNSNFMGYWEAHFKGDAIMIPTWFVVSVVLLLALLTGPVDYIVLGRLKLRMLTWLLFPSLCLFAAFFLKLYSDYVVGSKDRRSTVFVSDVGVDGSTLFRSRHLLIVPGRSKTVMEPFKGETLSQDFERYDVHDLRSGSTFYRGSIPDEFLLRRQYRQWEPVRLRTMALPGPQENLPWSFPSSLDNASLDVFAKRLSELYSGREAFFLASVEDGTAKLVAASSKPAFSETAKLGLLGHLRNHDVERAYDKGGRRFPVVEGSPLLCGANGFLSLGKSLVVFLRDGDDLKIYRRRYLP